MGWGATCVRACVSGGCGRGGRGPRGASLHARLVRTAAAASALQHGACHRVRTAVPARPAARQPARPAPAWGARATPEMRCDRLTRPARWPVASSLGSPRSSTSLSKLKGSAMRKRRRPASAGVRQRRKLRGRSVGHASDTAPTAAGGAARRAGGRAGSARRGALSCWQPARRSRRRVRGPAGRPTYLRRALRLTAGWWPVRHAEPACAPRCPTGQMPAGQTRGRAAATACRLPRPKPPPTGRYRRRRQRRQ